MFRFPGKMPKVFFFIQVGFFTRMNHSVFIRRWGRFVPICGVFVLVKSMEHHFF